MKSCGLHVDQDILQRYDAVLGPRVRQIAYFYILNFSFQVYRDAQSCGPIQMAVFNACEYIFGITKKMKVMMDMTEDEVAAAAATIRVEFERASHVLSQHEFLGSGSGASEFGGADLAFSALAGWVIMPENFHAGEVSLPQMDDLHGEYQALIVELRNTPAGRHILKCYKIHRTPIA
jgi:hypothetical protein